ncbi:MAG: site-2 protease family protein [Pseudomonadota bacterium]
MKWSVPVGRVLGIPIRIHLTFLLLLAWIAWLGWGVNGLSSSLWAVALILCLFACVVLHELGHSVVAIRFGAEVRSVTLLPIGGVATMKSIPEKPYQELLVSVAGPAVNVLIVCILAVFRGGFPAWLQVMDFPDSIRELLDELMRANLILALFNLLPAFPMDGGRVMRSFLALFLSYARATAVATMFGQLLAIGFVMIGLVTNPFLVIIGIFVFIGAESEERSVRVRSLLHDVFAEDVMVTSFVSLQPEDNIGRCLEYVYHRKQEDFPVEVDGRLIGVLARKDWLSALHREGPAMRVGDIMTQRFISLHPKARLSKLYQDMSLLKQGLFPVVDNGRLVGLLTAEDVGRYLMVQEAQKNAQRSGTGNPPGPESPSRFSIDLG